jgi:hypothetical protein
VGRKGQAIATRPLILLLTRWPGSEPLLFALRDTPTKRYGPKVQGAGIPRSPTPGPAGARFLYGQIRATLALASRYPFGGASGLPLMAALLVRQKDLEQLPQQFHWTFQTKLPLGDDSQASCTGRAASL